jgi:competence protein ComGC
VDRFYQGNEYLMASEQYEAAKQDFEYFLRLLYLAIHYSPMGSQGDKGTGGTIMNERILLRNHSGFALISIIVVLLIICFLAVRELPKFFSFDEDKDKIKKSTVNMTDGTVPKVGAITDDSKNIAGVAALAAATSNVQMVYAKLLVNNTSGTTITNADVVNLLNSSHTVVGDYVVSYSTSGTDKITATLQASSKGKFGTPNSKEIAFR